MVKAFFVIYDRVNKTIKEYVPVSSLYESYGQERAEELFQGFETELKEDSKLFVRQYLNKLDTPKNECLSICFCADNGETVSIRKSNNPYETINVLNELPTSEDGDKNPGLTLINQPLYTIPLSTAGEIHIQIEAYSKFVVPIKVLPNISEEEYNEILDDLKAICIRMIYSQSNNVVLEKNKGSDTEYLMLSEKVDAITQIVTSLSEDPQSDLVSVPAKLKWADVKKIDSRTIMDHYVFKKSKVRGTIHQKSFEIYENAQILKYLYSLLSEVKLLKAEYVRRKKESDIKSNIGNKSNDDPVSGFDILEKKLNRTINEKMFDNISPSTDDLRTTNLFINHPTYSKVYDIIGHHKKEELPFHKLSYSSLKVTHTIYELWCYFSILDILISKYQYKPVKYLDIMKNSSQSQFKDIESGSDFYLVLNKFLSEKINQKPSLWDLTFYLTKGDTEIYYGYNFTINYNSNNANDDETSVHKQSKMRPDILLIKKTPDECIMYTLDAKYQDYRNDALTISEWYKQMVECAAKKYLYQMEKREPITFPGLLDEQVLIDNNNNIKLYGSVLLHPGLVENGLLEIATSTGLLNTQDIKAIFDSYREKVESDEEIKDINDFVEHLSVQRNNNNKTKSVWGSFIFTPKKKLSLQHFIKDEIESSK